MPFDSAVKTRMFIRCSRICCLCLKQCGINIEAAHIIDEAAGGSNNEENGIPLCFDCHQEVGSYNDRHPRGNKIRPEELRARRDRVYALVAEGRIEILRPVNLPRLFDRRVAIKTSNRFVENPSVAEVLIAIDKLDHQNWDDAFLILEDRAWENAFVQACQEPTGLYWVEYRDGATQLQYRSTRQVSVEAVKLIFLSYMRLGDELMRHGVKWDEVTSTLGGKNPH
jgi:hypothetical protein